MAYINREEIIKKIKDVQSLYTGQFYALIRDVLEIIKTEPIATVDMLYKEAYEKGKEEIHWKNWK